MKKTTLFSPVALAMSGLLAVSLRASSHREAPLITQTPKVDAADFFAFNSYEPGRAGFVTLIANYVPLQDGYGGPNYFSMDPDALYEIHVDNSGDAVEDITFQFRFTNANQNISLNIGPAGNQKSVAIPLINAGPISAANTATLNLQESYTLNIIRGPRRTGPVAAVSDAAGGATTFKKPVDDIGNKSIPDYKAYAAAHIYSINIPGCPTPGRVFVGQRKDPFVVNLGETFDLVNLNPVGPANGARDSLADKNVTSLILEIPVACLITSPASPIVGCWTTASKIVAGTPVQLSRLGMPLVNEVVIGLKDKDLFNASEPKNDAQFADYVTHPTLPALLQALFGVTAPTAFPRTDLVSVFLTGVAGLNATGPAVAEMVRLNTSTPPVAAATQKNLGVLAGDVAGFPNGRRPGDDVVDMALRVVMGVLLPAPDAPSGQLPYTDGAKVDASFFDTTFPYLKSPVPGSPNSLSLNVILQAAAHLGDPWLNIAASYDPGRRKISAAKVTPGQGFYRLSADGPIKPTDVAVDQVPGQVEIGVAKP